ncbi:MAG TPA: hypothetical protein PKO06_09375, partial [Candidatus Ozemobacteraceae bacterium]|nr:hypothetical protein [Candidatus Ozemobacteraceae bacterium]
LGIIVGLAVSHRPTLGVMVVMLIPILWPMSRLRSWVSSSALTGVLLGLLLGLAPLVDLYQRLQNPERQLIDPLIGRGFEGFWSFFTAADFRKAVGVFGPLELLARAKHWGWLVAEQGTPALLLLPLFTLRQLPLSREAMALIWIMLFNSGFILNYNAYDAHTMLMPSFLALTGLSALFLAKVDGPRKKWLTPAFLFLVANSLFVNGYTREPAERQCESFTYRLTALMPQGSTIFVNDDLEFRPLLYLRQTRQFRSDLSLHLIDAFQEQDLPAIRGDFARGPVFSTLVFPESLAPLLNREYHLVPWGYAWRVLPANISPTPAPDVRWGREVSLAGSATFQVADHCAILKHRVPGQDDGPAILPGDVLQYEYRLASAGPLADSLVVAPFLVSLDGALPAEKGVVLGHDLHIVGTGSCRSSTWYQERYHALYQRRQLIVPEFLRPGRYDVRLLLTTTDKLAQSHLLLERLPRANLLGEQGETELFRLQNGLGLRPLVDAALTPTWNRLLESGPAWVNASSPIVLGSFEIPASPR